ncbi:MAG: prepilin-type N-terminal cleavage/methylation domain-containing protein [Methylomarinum sp.]|nr:prepilin-type N-terminal cleavage/methylation domain-containing protein [Methylomarinum sp.]
MISKNKGFSLLEILVAFTIMAVSLGIVLKIFSSGVNTAVISEDYIIATQIAESLMAKAGVEETLEISEKSGIEGEKYQWQVRIENNETFEITEDSEVELLNVQVIVKWDVNLANGRAVELNTIKTRSQR